MDVTKLVVVLFLSIFVIQCEKQNNNPEDRQFKRSDNNGCDEQAISEEYLVHWKNGDITVENAKNDTEFIKNFLEENRDSIKSSEPHYKISVLKDRKITINNFEGPVNWGVEAIEASSGWGKTGLEEDVIVAVIDSGMDTTHPELQNVMAVNEEEVYGNGIDDDGNGLVDDRYGYDFVTDSPDVKDYSGHGTHVAGIIAAQHNSGSIIGAASPNVKLLPLAFIGSNGSGSILNALNSIRYAAHRGAKVINASWGGPGCSLELKNEIAALAQKNILFVAAAGNEGNDLELRPEYPAGFIIDNQISVGASEYGGARAGFSNWGNRVDLVAPGAHIESTYPIHLDINDEIDGDGISGDGLRALNGTSMAAPFVAASAALLWSHFPEASYVDIKQALLLGVTPGPFDVKTRGQLNVLNSLNILNN